MKRRLWIALLVVAAATGTVGWALTHDDEEPIFCHADGLLGPNGEIYGRSGDAGCRFVDENGDVITELDGQPVCYTDGAELHRGDECDELAGPPATPLVR